MRVTNLKVVESTNNRLNDIILNLIETDYMLYSCKNHKINVIDTYYEIEQMKIEFKNTGSMVFWDLHLTVASEKELIFINKVVLIDE